MIMRILMTLVSSGDHDDYEEFHVVQRLDPAILASSEDFDCYKDFDDYFEDFDDHHEIFMLLRD